MTSFHERLAAAATKRPPLEADATPIGRDWVEYAKALEAACPPEMVQAWENGMKALICHRFPASFKVDPAWRNLSTPCRERPEIPEAGYCPACAALAVYDAQVAALQEHECDGSSECQASRHVLGCFAGDKEQVAALQEDNDEKS